MISEPLYALRPAEVFRALESSPKGITTEQARQRLTAYGPNTLREPPPPPRWRMFAAQLIHPMALVLWAAGLIAILSIAHAVLGLAIWAVVLANAAFSFWQERRTQRAMTALKHLLPAHARVIREGHEQEIPASDVVVGDVLVLAEGDNIPADARVVEEFGLRTNNANLTGPSASFTATADSTAPAGGAFTANGQAASGAGTSSYLNSGTTLTINNRTDYTDGGSGLANSTLTIQSATLTGNTCGSYGGTTVIAGIDSVISAATNATNGYFAVLLLAIVFLWLRPRGIIANG